MITIKIVENSVSLLQRFSHDIYRGGACIVHLEHADRRVAVCHYSPETGLVAPADLEPGDLIACCYPALAADDPRIEPEHQILGDWNEVTFVHFQPGKMTLYPASEEGPLLDYDPSQPISLKKARKVRIQKTRRCPACTGTGLYMGNLGRAAQYRCENCGMIFTHYVQIRRSK